MPRHPALSQAADGLSAQVYTSLLALAHESGHEVFALNVGDTAREPPEAASVSGLARTRTPGLHRYAEVRGEPALLDAIVADHARRGRPVARARIQVTAGGTSALDLACRALLAPGDEVIVLAPYWPLIRGIVSAAGAVPVEVPWYTELRRPGFDLEGTLRAALSARTAALYVNNPNNPTGIVLTAAEIDVLAQFARDHDLWLLSDEAYERLGYGAHATAMPAIWQHEAVRERAVVVHTFSKSFGLAGARVGYLHGPEAAIEALSGLQTFTTYCAPRPMQAAAAAALAPEVGDPWLEAARSDYHRAAALTAEALRIPVPESGTFVFFDTAPLRAPREDAHAFLARLARAGVVLTPGRAAGSAYDGWARLCFTAVALPTLERALATLERVMYAEPR